ncbi:hypothetical protein SRRS_24440 [Sporomusa rhizae]|uniref:hypothetical protein n=1 Tax=Sporomusa rhizae TaxID=357999 RepID=UPI00352B1449
MYIEKRKNGTFYLKESIYNPETKLPKNTSIYLGSNPIQAKEKLKQYTDDLVILNQIPDMQLYEIELNKIIKELQKVNQIQSEGVNRIFEDYLTVLINARQFILTAKGGIVVRTADCPNCRFNKPTYCEHFKQNFVSSQGKYRDGKLPRCIASELGRSEPIGRGMIKFPRDFRG